MELWSQGQEERIWSESIQFSLPFLTEENIYMLMIYCKVPTIEIDPLSKKPVQL